VVGAGDLRAQARQAFANLKEVLDLARARPADVTKLTVYVVNLVPGDLAAIREAAPAFSPGGTRLPAQWWVSPRCLRPAC